MPTVMDGYVEAANDEIKVVLGWAGEGLYGDYNKEDPYDEPLIRADVYERVDGDVKEEWCDDPSGSTCTTENANMSIDEARVYAMELLEKITKTWKRVGAGHALENAV